MKILSADYSLAIEPGRGKGYALWVRVRGWSRSEIFTGIEGTTSISGWVGYTSLVEDSEVDAYFERWELESMLKPPTSCTKRVPSM